MNPHLAALQPYPFEKLRALFAGAQAPAHLKPINLTIGEPKHPTPAHVRQALVDHLDGLASYPTTLGNLSLRQSIAAWLQRRYGLPAVDPATQVLPVNGSREALFAFAQAVLDPAPDAQGRPPVVLSPNPFYQIYEGAALLAGADPVFIDADPARNFGCDYSQVPDSLWQRVRLAFVCSPGNPTGAVIDLDGWRQLFELSDRHGFIIASDECYSEIYFDETRPPLGALQAAHQLGRDFTRLVAFSSLSKRSNVPGMRSGFVAGDPALLKAFLLYRTYHGCAMNPAVQAASEAAWNDEAHVIDNRRQYAAKFAAVTPRLARVLDVRLPDAAFYLWARTPIEDTAFARGLLEAYNVQVLPGSFLARSHDGINPGSHFIRIALVAGLDECVEAAERIVAYCEALKRSQDVAA